MESTALWQGLSLCGIVSWIVMSSCLNVTQKFRSLLQPLVVHHVITGTPTLVHIQKYRHGVLDGLFSALSFAVSTPFYTAFLPLLFWGGHAKLARQMTLLMALCDYLGNSIKDLVSAPRPICPPVRRITGTKDEEDHALEYGLPSSHTLNTVCLSGYLLHYVLSHTQNQDGSLELLGFAIVCLLVFLTGFGRIYLGMHSVIDVIGGLAMGLLILYLWLTVYEHVDNFIVSGQNVGQIWPSEHLNSKLLKSEVQVSKYGKFARFPYIGIHNFAVTTFWALLSFLLLFAYPTPEHPTPSFEHHTAFDGVAFGIVAGIQQTYHQFHHEGVPRMFTGQLTVPTFFGRMLVGIPTILVAKLCSKALAKRVLPAVSKSLGIPIKSTCYIPMLNGPASDKNTEEIRQSGCIQKLFFFCKQDSFDVDTGIRFLQYTGLAWAVVDLVPSLFSRLKL